jgi:eukaryotic-like serine/threonine-protein kinase
MGAADEPLDAAISPDQHEIVFVATQLRRDAGDQPFPGTPQLWRRRFAAERAQRIVGTDGARLPAWKQTGRVLSFFSGGHLKLSNLEDGAIAEVADAPDPAGATWLRDGSLLFASGHGPIRRLASGRITEATRLGGGDVAHVFPLTVDGGDDFTYVAIRSDGRRVVRLSARGLETDLGRTAAHATLVGRGWLLFMRDNTLLADYREPDGRMAGSILPLVLDVGTTSLGRGLFVASTDVLIHSKAAERPRRIVWLDMRGTQVDAVADVGDYWQVRLSPDDRRLAVTTRDALLRSLDVLMIPVDAPSATLRLTTALAAESHPVWSPDGGRLLFQSMQRGRPEVFVTATTVSPAAGAHIAAQPAVPVGEVPTDWRDSEMLVQVRRPAGFDLVRATTDGVTRPVADSPFNETDGRWSPDGRWIAYVSDESGRSDIYVVEARAQTASETVQRVSFGGGTQPRWTRDGRALLFLRGSTIMHAPLAAGATRFAAPERLFDVAGIRDYDVGRNGRIIALLPVPTETIDDVSVILNWRSVAENERRRSQKAVPPKF